MSKSSKSNQAPEGTASGHGDQEVGYCKPPKEHQFKPGNKFGKGRPQGSKNLKTIVIEAMGQKVAVKMGGKTKKLSKVELTVHQVVTKASQGDLKAAEKALGLYERYGPQEDSGGPQPEKVGRDLDALRNYLTIMNQIHPPEGEEDENE